MWLAIGAFFGFAAVAAGAFGAHALTGHLSAPSQQLFELAVRYEMYHALALVGVGIIGLHRSTRWLNRSGACFTFGILVFSGTIYGLALGGPRWLGAVTPIGGVLLLMGWLALLAEGLTAWRSSLRREVQDPEA